MLFEIKRVCFSYHRLKVLDDLCLSLEPGRFYGIIGPNGCGKTTFLDLLIRHHLPASGEIIYKGRNLSCYSRKQLSREMALVPQNFYINFPYTAKEIVFMGRYPHLPRFGAPSAKDVSIVDSVMEATGTDAFKNRFITELSGGERQRVVLARALAQDAPVLIMDEATSNLDINHAISLMNLVADDVRQKKKTVVAVFQDINLAAVYCEYLVLLREGRVAFHGPASAVLNRDTIKTVFDVEAKVYFETYSNSTQVIFKR